MRLTGINSIIRDMLRKLGLDIRRYKLSPEERCLSLGKKRASRGHVLLALWIEPFFFKESEIPNDHTHSWESFCIAKIFLNLGYDVDVIDYRNAKFIPQKEYAFFVSFRTNFEIIARQLNDNCIKIVHLDTAHWLFNNSASFKRGLEAQRRKKGVLMGLRVVESNLAIEYADYATVLGNEFTMGTYMYAGKQIFRIPISSCAVYPWQEDKDFASCRKNFLWFGSGGAVHKGLDLVLEAFMDMPDYQITVCGSIRGDKKFLEFYERELNHAPNIHMVGWVDLESQFSDIAKKCVALLFPSCSEGQAGSAVLCLHAGLIPVISLETGVDVHDFGVILKKCSIEEIQRSVRRISELPVQELKTMSRKAWEYARSNHTRENFAREYLAVIKKIMNKRSI